MHTTGTDNQAEHTPARRNREVQALAAVAAAASKSLDLHGVLQRTLQEMMAVSDSDAGLAVRFGKNLQYVKVISRPASLSEGLENLTLDYEEDEDETFRRISAAQAWATTLKNRLEATGYLHTISVPIMANDKVYGVYALGSKTTLAVQSIDIFVAMARQIGLAVENAYTHATLREEKERLETLYAIGNTLATSLQMDALADLILKESLRATGLNRASLWLLQGDEVECFAEINPLSHRWSILGRRDRLQATQILKRLANTRYPVIVNATQDLVTQGLVSDDRVQRYDLLSFLAVPLIYRDHVHGFLVVDEAGRQRIFTEEDAQFLAHLANQVALAIHNAQLFDQVVQEKRQVEAVLSSFADGVCVTDIHCRILHFNPGAEQLTGWPTVEVIGKTCDAVLDMKNERGLSLCQEGDCLIRQATENLSTPTLPKFHKHLIRHRNGDAVPAFITIAPWLNDKGIYKGRVIALWDARGEERIDQLKDEFLSMIWHELRTPVSNISIATQLLQQGSDNISPAIIEDVINIVEVQSDRLTHLTSQVMRAAELSVGEMPVQLRPTALLPVLHRAINMILPSAGQTRLRFTPTQEDRLWVMADEDHLVSVITSLIDNALKYAAESEEIVLSAGKVAGSNVVDIAVQDFGPGIGVRHQEHIFDKFYRVNSAESRRVYGTGLGLYLSRKLIEVQGGTLTVESQVGKGTTFHVQLSQVDSLEEKDGV